MDKTYRAKRKTSLNNDQKNVLLALLFILPTAYLLMKTFIYPVYQTIVWSFYHYDLMDGSASYYVGFKNYLDVLQSSDFQLAMNRTLIFTLLSVILELIFGFVSALLLNQNFKGRSFFRAVIIIPWALLTLVNGLTWEWILQPGYGGLTVILHQLHLLAPDVNPVWLADSNHLIYFVVIADVWKMTPFITIILLAGLQSISSDLYEASMLDGAGFWSKIRYITVPQLIPSIMMALVLRTMGAFKVYDVLTVFTGDATTSISYLTFNNAFRYFFLGKASAMAWMTAVVILILAIIYIRLLNKKED
ncbi:ABC transporter permease [Paenibacillus marchantiophytorum]|uniref:ABC transporter permease n=1 Tax=Paenibacillus marchantiophytorum TaxID=1619310 RepID=A0ABQ1FHG1_9BACL|nr:sugar ABC transporter permease [Paenibacillus marchantiophytorum]GGA13964.1 ABC transporter permease [Paenibacillus marchantiophytorum]